MIGRADENGRDCSKCLVYKPWSDFFKRKAGPYGHRPECKACYTMRRHPGRAVCQTCGKLSTHS